MTDGSYPPLTDGGGDDLPRTFRRERERQVREQQAAQQTQDRTGWDRGDRSRSVATSSPYGAPEAANPYDGPYAGDASGDADPAPATLRRIKVPFFSLMGFYIKSVFAAIPALLILIALLYGLGVLLQMYIPQLIKMKILISFP
jgi:hypothetical protein